MSNAALAFDELCPNCGEFFDCLNDDTGFCGNCSKELGVGVSSSETPTIVQESRIEVWLRRNADILESSMLEQQIPAKEAIKKLAEETKVYCLCCGNQIQRATNGRHFFCNKQPHCRKARRYYKYLQYEKGFSKELALEKAVEKFKQ